MNKTHLQITCTYVYLNILNLKYAEVMPGVVCNTNDMVVFAEK